MRVRSCLVISLMLSGCVTTASGKLSTGENLQGSINALSVKERRVQIDLPGNVACIGDYIRMESDTRRFPLTCSNGTTGNAIMTVTSRGMRDEQAEVKFLLSDGRDGTVTAFLRPAQSQPKVIDTPSAAQTSAATEKELTDTKTPKGKTRSQMFKEMADPNHTLELVSKPTKVTSNDVAEAKNSLIGQLVDPGSVKWGRTFKPRSVIEEQYVGGKKKLRVMCGTANAKNRMGGYNGMNYWLAIDYGDGFKVLRFGGGAEILCQHYGALQG